MNRETLETTLRQNVTKLRSLYLDEKTCTLEMITSLLRIAAIHEELAEKDPAFKEIHLRQAAKMKQLANHWIRQCREPPAES